MSTMKTRIWGRALATALLLFWTALTGAYAAAAELDLAQIWQLVDELIEAHEGWLPEFSVGRSHG